MKNKKTIIILFLSLIILVALTTATIAAWLTDSKTTPDITFTVGEVKYTWSGSTVSSPVVPGQELISTPYTLTNDSNVATELRVKVEVTSSTLSGNAQHLCNLGMKSGWVLEATDGLWYYRGTDTVFEETSQKYKIPTTVSTITVVESLKLDGSKVGNTHKNDTITVMFTFEAKQNDYVTWDQLGTAQIDFTTGLPNQ